MAHLIDKDALVAEIERYKKEEGWCQVGKDTADVYYARGFRFACERIISFIDMQKLKEVDLEKHLKEDIEDVFFDLNGVAVKGATYYLTVEDVKDIARYFFELGRAASNKVQKGE